MNNLKLLRTSLHLTQQEIADKLGISRTSYTRYELGNREPDNSTLIKLSDIFGVTVDYLLGKNDDAKEKKNNELIEKIDNLSPENQKKAKEYIAMLETLEKLKEKEKPVDFSKKA